MLFRGEFGEVQIFSSICKYCALCYLFISLIKAWFTLKFNSGQTTNNQVMKIYTQEHQGRTKLLTKNSDHFIKYIRHEKSHKIITSIAKLNHTARYKTDLKLKLYTEQNKSKNSLDTKIHRQIFILTTHMNICIFKHDKTFD